MRERVVFMVVIAGAAGLGAVLLSPRLRRPTEAPPAASAVEVAPPPPPEVAVRADAGGPARAAPVPAYVHVDPASGAVCGEGMVLVDGVYCPYVGHRCLHFANEAGDVCERYAPEVLCEGRLEHRRFCIDLFEYPDLEGVVPAVMVDFDDAKRGCAVEGKRLCSVEEWEFACEGTQMWPYPYGLDRDPEACNIDRPVTMPDLPAFSDPWKVSGEVGRLDRRLPSGAMGRCISPFGVRDMTGNVDEWVENRNGKVDEKPYRSALKGGYWGPIRARCRPMTSSHNQWFSFYQVGFRCCRNAGGRD
jgi:formylglycine-generating enzyme